FVERLLEGDPCVVQGNIQSPEFRNGEVDKLLHVVFNAHVRGDVASRSACSDDFLLYRMPESLSAPAESDAGSLPSERDGRGSADSGGCTRNHDHLVDKALAGVLRPGGGRHFVGANTDSGSKSRDAGRRRARTADEPCTARYRPARHV